jgi:hypothetical protein
MFTPMARLTKLLKLAKPVIAKPITKPKMINKTITNSVFPDQLKQAQVVALHKKNNARPWTGPLVLLQCIYFGLVPVSNLL